MDDCIFCKIVKGDLPSYKLYEDDLVLGFLDAYPSTKGHSLIIPKKHSKNLYEIDEESLKRIAKVSKELSIKLKEKLNCDGLNVLQSNEKNAGQVIFHYHLHLIPRYSNDGLKIGLHSNKEKINLEELHKELGE